MNEESKPHNFIRNIIEEDLRQGKNDGRLATRFPPEPNGYLHIGHAKSICLNFGIARDYQGATCNLRFDDTNPEAEKEEFVEAIKRDVRWLGFDWQDRLFTTSSYFEQLYDFALDLIRAGKAYVCSLTPEQMREYRGTLTEAGRNSPSRELSVEENLDLFQRMKSGEFADGGKVLRAKIDMASPNMNLRDPVLYRIKHLQHQATGNSWCIYPMYDYSHPISDALEGITHSLCTLEFEDHRPLYDWVIDQLDLPCQPRQIEFSRLNLEYTVVSKRKLLQLVNEKQVSGWDDPRMPTLSGLRRRGYTPASIRDFCERVGVTKKDNSIEMGLLESCIREDLDPSTKRAMAVLKPLKVVIENYPEGEIEELDAPWHPKNSEMGSRKLPFGRELYIEQDDFMMDPPKNFFRLGPGREVRLRYAYFIRCESLIQNEHGEITELRCTYDPLTKGGSAPDGRKVKGTLHWVSVPHSLTAEVRLYDRLFSVSAPEADPDGKNFLALLNPNSLEVLKECRVEQAMDGLAKRDSAQIQFERTGYFIADSEDSAPGKLVYNRVVTLRDTWAKISGD